MLFFAATMLACRQTPNGPESEFYSAALEGPTMGTHYIVKIARARDKSALDTAGQRVPEVLANIDSMMSTYKSDSELSRFNQHQSTEPFKVSPDMIAIFKLAREVSDATRGAFDVTIGPVVNAWGFGPEKHGKTPTQAEIAALLPRVGYAMVTVDEAASTLSKSRPDIFCDLSGIAQGYAADRVAATLDDLGLTDYMIDVSGEFRVAGHNDAGEPWRIAIERPDSPERTAELVVPLSKRSLATSGDYRNYVEVNGKRQSHEIDPTTGLPISHGLASVTVIADNCGKADAYATGLIVLGPEAGYALAVEKEIPAYFLVRNQAGGFDERKTPKFDELLKVVQ